MNQQILNSQPTHHRHLGQIGFLGVSNGDVLSSNFSFPLKMYLKRKNLIHRHLLTFSFQTQTSDANACIFKPHKNYNTTLIKKKTNLC